jgi:3-methylcrotonyl-CoA carboxylase alpha subunit
MVRLFNSILIANRGEIACRIVTTARRMGLRTIAVYSDADSRARHVRMADEAHRIGPAPARDSYLVADAIIAAAKASGAQSIHPGYGFLSENADFAERCEREGIVFIGPPASAIRAMGLKDAAKALMQKAGVPIVPGYFGDDQGAGFLAAQAQAIGFPVLIKAVAGGGGKGMRRVDDAAGFPAALESAQREAASAFGNPRVLIERYVAAPRHIEIQVFADTQGNAIHLNERDCSLQRRHQKVIEEAPAPGMSVALRERMGRAAVEAAKAVGYAGAGTVEFIADSSRGLREDGFFFMEMNTRLQVEHPVTEGITGLDLVEWQIRVASGEQLPLQQDEVPLAGHAVEARLYAEDADHGFLPSTGRLVALELPSGAGVRVDTGVEAGDEVTPFYDPMIAKLIATGPTRDEALDRLSTALGATLVAGPKTNAAFLRALCDAPDFRAGAFDTGFIDRALALLTSTMPDPGAIADGIAGALAQRVAMLAVIARDHSTMPDDPWSTPDGFQYVGERRTPVAALVDGEPVVAEWRGGLDDFSSDRLVIAGATRTSGATRVVADGERIFALAGGRQWEIRLADPLDVDAEGTTEGDAIIKAPMHGKLVIVLVAKGDRVAKGQRLAIVEAMKMEHALVAPFDGTIAEVRGSAGVQVAQGETIIAVHRED